MRIGLIGCGDIGALRAAALDRLSTLKLVSVSDIDSVRANNLARSRGAAVVSDWRSMVSQEGIDAVIVSTPPHLHAEMCIGALEAGKHVICEKPLARTPDECQAIIEAARRADRLLATGFNYRFYPSVQKARSILDSGLIGELDHIRSYAGYSAAEHSHPWLHDVKVMGGGALRDNGIHLIDLTCYFLGDVAEVKGFAQDSFWGFEGCEDNGFVLMRNSAGRVASLQASWTEWKGYRFLIELYGTRGMIRVSCFPMLTQVVWAEKAGSKTRRKTFFFPRTHIMEHLRSYRWVVIESFVQELDAFEKAIRGQATEIATGRDGLRAVEVAHRATQYSGNTGTEERYASANRSPQRLRSVRAGPGIDP
ncbi:MAG TPA: Gfo/Idh/MocA family oxidoreductase [Blastocatellia bacterium]|nr:Gfo/Idh/MocA family oxidoreductase [Blastocatellia bacterium]